MAEYVEDSEMINLLIKLRMRVAELAQTYEGVDASLEYVWVGAADTLLLRRLGAQEMIDRFGRCAPQPIDQGLIQRNGYRQAWRDAAAASIVRIVEGMRLEYDD